MSWPEVARSLREAGVPAGAVGAAFMVIDAGGSAREALDALLAAEARFGVGPTAPRPGAADDAAEPGVTPRGGWRAAPPPDCGRLDLDVFAEAYWLARRGETEADPRDADELLWPLAPPVSQR